MKGQNMEEIEESKYGINLLAASIESIKEIKLPKEDSQRTIIKIKKQGPTNKKYPRSYEKIIKQPLKK